MQSTQQQNIIGFIWNIANKLRGPYRPPQYRRVMLPLIVLRRLDLVLAENKQDVLDEKQKLEAKGITGQALEKALARVAVKDRKQPLFNTSGFTFEKLLGDAPNIAGNLIAYIQGFSTLARDIFDKFEFESEIAKLDESNRLFLVIKEFCSAEINLSPKAISNLQMGTLFEELVRKFNEQANEEAGDHFTPREVIRLMVQLVFTGEEGIYEKGISRSVYDPTAGTGGMISEAEKYICGDGATTGLNPDAHIQLFGQEYNPEAYAICCSDLLIKDEPIDNLIYGDTLGVKDAKNKTNGFVPHDGHPGRQFHYMLSNPPFGVEWKPEEDFVREEYKNLGFSGRFGAGLPRINDGALLFLQHMISKMHRPPKVNELGKNVGGDGSKIAIVFNGSPLFTGDAGSGESNIRRWIIEQDMLDAVIALPDQMFYNTGIYTYIWVVTNKKPAHRQGKVQLIDGTRHFKKMDKSLGNKRNEMSDDHIKELVRLYAEHDHDAEGEVLVDGKPERRVCSKLFDNREFGFLKITVERPLRLNFQASAERIARLDDQSAFVNLASSKKRKDEAACREEIAEGEATQQAIRSVLQGLDGDTLYRNRPKFELVLDKAMKKAGIKIGAPIKKAILTALSVRDPEADVCLDAKGKTEPDAELRDTESVELPDDITLPLPLGYDTETGHDRLLDLVKGHCEEYLKAEVLPHVSDAWIDHSKTKVGYEIPLNRHFYVYQPPRSLDVIEGEIKILEQEIMAMLAETEKCRVIIRNAVTKGLDPSATMRDSGVDWLGEIPVHWNIKRLKFCVTIHGGGTPSTSKPEYWNGEIPWVSPKDMKNDLIESTEDYLTELGVRESATKVIPKNAVLIVVRSGILRHTIPVAKNVVEVTLNQDMKALIPNKWLCVDFLHYFISGLQGGLLPLWSKQGCTVESIEIDCMVNTPIPLPPLDEQEAIVTHIINALEKIELQTSKIGSAIKTLEEYRSALITNSVTGKIDVRDFVIPVTDEGAAYA